MYRILITLLLITAIGKAQDLSYQEIDTKTLELYEKENWYELANYGKTLEPQKVDYYLYNVRLGIANFNLGAYYTAKCYFNHALKNNKTDLAGEYLYWCYINLGQVERAKEAYKELTPETQKIIKNCNKVVSSLYAEVGYKSSSSLRQDDLTYYSLAGTHRFTDKLSAVSSFGVIGQDSGWETNSQYQIGFMPSYYLGKGSSVSLGYVYANNTNERITTPTGFPFPTKTAIVNNVFLASYVKQLHRLRLEGFIQQINQSKNTTGAITIPESLSNTNIGLNIAYTLPINRDGLSIGGSVVSAFGSSRAFLFSPFVAAKVSSKLFLKASYYSVNKFLYLDKESNILFTNADTKTSRIASVLTYTINPNWQVVGTYSNETITNTDTILNHKLNSFFVGLNYNF